MGTKPILSICIATYNRVNYLLELVTSILELERDDIEVAVTDNASTDDTVELLRNIKDNRLKVYVNEKNIGGANNTLMAVYNARGKYALYCNDRDLIEVDKINKLIGILKTGEFSSVVMQRVSNKNKDSLFVFDKGVESLVNQRYTHHPTGLVLNREIIEKNNLKIEKFFDINNLYAIDYLLRELLLYGKSAIYSEGIWHERNREFIANNKSSFQNKNVKLYFYPDVWIEQYIQANKHLLTLLGNDFSKEDKEECILSCALFFASNIIIYKNCMQSKSETQHYGIKRKYVSVFSLLKSLSELNMYIEEQIVKNCKDSNCLVKWKKLYKNQKKNIIIRCMKTDINCILGRIK